MKRFLPLPLLPLSAIPAMFASLGFAGGCSLHLHVWGSYYGDVKNDPIERKADVYPSNLGSFGVGDVEPGRDAARRSSDGRDRDGMVE